MWMCPSQSLCGCPDQRQRGTFSPLWYCRKPNCLILKITCTSENQVKNTSSAWGEDCCHLPSITYSSVYSHFVHPTGKIISKRCLKGLLKQFYLKVVIDQVLLWERDINRVQSNTSYMYHEFPSNEVFEKAVKFAKSIDMYLWDDGRSRLIAKSEGKPTQYSVLILDMMQTTDRVLLLQGIHRWGTTLSA